MLKSQNTNEIKKNNNEHLKEKIVKKIDIHPVIINIVFEDTILVNKSSNP